MVEGIENKEQWEGPEFQDTSSSGQEREDKIFTFYRMEEEGERYFTPCYLCLEYEEKNRENLVKRELLVSLKGEFYFVKFVLNPEEDDVEPSVILGRSFMRLAKRIADFGNGIITIQPELDPFLDDSEETEKFKDDWDHLLDINFGDIPEINNIGLLPFVCKMGKSKRNKKRALKNFQLYYSDVGPSMSNEKPLTQEEATREALAIDICKRFSLLEEERPVIKTMTYSDKYKKILDGIIMDKIKLDGEIKKEEEEAINQVKGEALKEKEDPVAFIIPIRLEAKIDLNALADTSSDINVMPYRTYAKLVGVTTIIAKCLILDMPIDRDTPILAGRRFLYTCGGILNTRDRITSTFDGICHQTFRVAKTSLNTEESDSDDEEDYGIQRNSFWSTNKAIGFLGSLPVPLQHMEWKPDYKGNFCKKEEGDGQWHAEIRLTDPYGNVYDQGDHLLTIIRSSEARSWSIPSEDPYEEVARQLLEQASRSPEYVPDPMELEDHVPVYIPGPEHHEDLVSAEDEAPTPLLPPSFLSSRIRPPRTRATIAQMRAIAPSTYHPLLPSGTPPLLPIPLPAPSTSRRADIPEADTPPRKRLLLTTPRPSCEVGESSAAAAVIRSDYTLKYI
ncbi:hypothetical protein Tco_1311845 [Tanacetum coccineum]